jgi:hypothetical protein
MSSFVYVYVRKYKTYCNLTQGFLRKNMKTFTNLQGKLMKLKDYFDKYHIKILRFARANKIAHTTLYNVMKGQPVSYKVAEKICKATKGDVPLLQLLEGEK